MRCRKSLERECERLELALKQLRSEMRDDITVTGPSIHQMINEAHLSGQIQAIKMILEPEPGGWPHDAWFGYVDARRDAVHSLVKAGKDYPEIVEILNITEIQARLIIKIDESDSSKN